jgi:hypothetical protein
MQEKFRLMVFKLKPRPFYPLTPTLFLRERELTA